jgi:endonuclease G
MAHLTRPQLFDVHGTAVQSGLVNKREELLGGLSILFIARLQVTNNPSDQLLLDLSEMNQLEGKIIGGIVPLETWLRNASYLTAAFPEKQHFFRELADQIAGNVPPDPPPNVATPVDLPEKILFVNALLSYDFLAGAQKTGRSVARLLVPRYERGAPVNFPNSNKPIRYLGTGWLLGRRHVITNRHVVNARSNGEADAADTDLGKQVSMTTVQFDYDHENAEGDGRAVAKLAVASKALDYAILELTEDGGRDPLVLKDGELALPKPGPTSHYGDYLPVNIIQHPSGAPKQLAVRNNLVARIRDKDFAYFTDTQGGSSGSPVCNDDWQVIGLHYGSTMSLGAVEFQGKRTAWINVGMRIDRILADLRQNHAALYQSIGVSLAVGQA